MQITRPKGFSIVLVLSLFCVVLEAKDLGIQGERFPIQEEDLANVFHRALMDQLSSESMQEITRDLKVKAHKPKPVLLSEAPSSRIHYFDPTYTVQEPIKDHNGAILFRKGSTLNPLKKIRLSSGLLFIDGDNPAHLLWARKLQGEFKWILVKGQPLFLESQEKRPIYFDQSGFLTSKLHIQSVPAKVTQEGELLRIEEVAITPEGEEQ